MSNTIELLRECREYFAARYIGEPAEKLRAKLDAALRAAPAPEPAPCPTISKTPKHKDNWGEFELLPCPFCGSHELGQEVAGVVYCLKCNAQTSPPHNWNLRPPTITNVPSGTGFSAEPASGVVQNSKRYEWLKEHCGHAISECYSEPAPAECGIHFDWQQTKPGEGPNIDAAIDAVMRQGSDKT